MQPLHSIEALSRKRESDDERAVQHRLDELATRIVAPDNRWLKVRQLHIAKRIVAPKRIGDDDAPPCNRFNRFKRRLRSQPMAIMYAWNNWQRRRAGTRAQFLHLMRIMFDWNRSAVRRCIRWVDEGLVEPPDRRRKAAAGGGEVMDLCELDVEFVVSDDDGGMTMDDDSTQMPAAAAIKRKRAL